jgi:hypothetical protein
VVIKLNNGISGQGNAILELAGLGETLASSRTAFCADDESWPSFQAKIASEGAIVEEMIRGQGLQSPSVQLLISLEGVVEVLSTHDQIMSDAHGQVYFGCRFPARADCRLAIQKAAREVGEVLATEGVIGFVGVDFVVDGHKLFLSEINLRMSATTHPYWMARLVTGSRYDPSGELRLASGACRSYVATDGLKGPCLVGRQPADIIAAVDRYGLAYDSGSATGVTLHLMGALPEAGKMGVTCIAPTVAEADELYGAVRDALRTRP